ncbi:hypothetical protein DPMN_018057 [Dreissena polymorpha]|uniref:Uncharacterized protein n=1 Tax=Dreissena polymorpha TaxID=45954 RepID=A0A9D4NGG0_DREPO|nr:hypothetical protein DPMN_018057 [Dreissena polymorpha]
MSLTPLSKPPINRVNNIRVPRDPLFNAVLSSQQPSTYAGACTQTTYFHAPTEATIRAHVGNSKLPTVQPL